MPVLTPINTHKTNGLNKKIEIFASGRSAGGAPLSYLVLLPDDNVPITAVMPHVQVGNAPGQTIYSVDTDDSMEVITDDTAQSALIIRGDSQAESYRLLRLDFQNGSFDQVGVKGITNEVVLAIMINRLGEFQAGACPSRENEQALVKLHEARMWLHTRQLDRQLRRVEGKVQP